MNSYNNTKIDLRRSEIWNKWLAGWLFVTAFLSWGIMLIDYPTSNVILDKVWGIGMGVLAFNLMFICGVFFTFFYSPLTPKIKETNEVNGYDKAKSGLDKLKKFGKENNKVKVKE